MTSRCRCRGKRLVETRLLLLVVRLGFRVGEDEAAETHRRAAYRDKAMVVQRYRGTPLIVTYHPAYLLRNLVDKSKSWEDLCFAVETMTALKQQQAVPN